MKKMLFAVILLASVSAFAADANPPAKDGAYYMKKTGAKVGRVTLALGNSVVKGIGHLIFKDAPKVGVGAAKVGVHVGKDAVEVGKEVVSDVKK